MNIYSNVTEQDLINLRRLAEQQKNQRAPKIKNRILKQTHDVKLAESFNPITKNLDEVKESIQKSGDIVKESNTPQVAIENTPAHQSIDNTDGATYAVELENTLQNRKDNTGFYKTHYDPQRRWMMNKDPIKMLRGTEVKIINIEYNVTPGIQKVITDKSYNTAKSMNDKEKLVFRDILQETN